MKKTNTKMMLFLNKYQQKVVYSKDIAHSKKFYISIIILGSIILFSFIVNGYSSKTPTPRLSKRVVLAYDPYPEIKHASFASEKNTVSYTPKHVDEAAYIKPIHPETGHISIKRGEGFKKSDKFSGFVKKDDSLWTIFRRQNIPPSIINAVSKSSKKIYNLSRLRQGERYTVSLDENGNLDGFQLETRDERVVSVTKDKKKNIFISTVRPFKYDTEIKIINTEIKDSIFEAILKEGELSSLASIISSIFEWQIDFVLDVRKGDTFKAIFEKKYRKGKFVRYGKVLGAEFFNKQRVYSAVLFADSRGIENYYDYEGNSLRKQFLKSPLRYTRISSGFSRRRFHPILKRYIPHLGIDYAAPIGTPVRAVGDGRVVWARYKGPNGKLVMIKHNGIYTTTYSHLSRFAKGIKKGVYVKQGQVIGYVGSTGRSTGPHLDFHIKKYGKDINPLKLRIPSAMSVFKKDKNRFDKVRKEITAKLHNNTGILVAEKK